MDKSINNFFYPNSICIAGASTKEKSLGYEFLKNIKKFNYKGNVLPVNPNSDEILGYKCYTSVTQIPTTIDLAVVLVPKRFVLETIDELLTKGVKSIILITAGFKETGEEGESLENKIIDKITTAGARLVGPNCMGVINSTNTNLNATFISEMPKHGELAFLSQSGALGATILNSLRESNINFAHFISVGNKADMNENDFLEFWEKDNNIKVITYYLESFENGFEFIKPFLLNKISKPVIILKAGNTESGMRAASSHTGALSSENRIVDSLLKQAGIIRVATVNDMFNIAQGFDFFSIPKGNKVAIVTNAGGPSILLTDKLDEEGLTLSNLSTETKSNLRKIVHPEGSINNPIDLLPSGNAETFSEAIKILLKDNNVDSVVSLFVEPGFINPMEISVAINNIKSVKPIFSIIMPKPEFWNQYRNLSEFQKPIFKNPEDPAKVLSNMLFHSNIKKLRAKAVLEIEELFKSVSKNVFNFSSGYISQDKISKVCNHYNLPLVKELLVSADFTQLSKIDFYPVVVKGISQGVIHKSEFDAVKLNIRNQTELLKAIEEIKTSFRKNGFEVESFLIQQFIKAKHEVLLGGYRDKSFGPVIMFGTGGKYVEVINDTAIRSAFISKEEIRETILSTSMGQILNGVRNEPSIDMEQMITLIQNSVKMIVENSGIIEFDFNPIIVDVNNNLHAVDVRIKFE